MDSVVVMALVAGGASLVSGVMATILSRIRSDVKGLANTRTTRSSKRAELKATGKALQESLEVSARSKRRFGILVVVSLAFFSSSIVSVVLADKGIDGWYRLAVLVGTFALAGLLAALVFAVVLMAYRSVTHSQESLEQKVEQVHKQLVRR